MSRKSRRLNGAIKNSKQVQERRQGGANPIAPKPDGKKEQERQKRQRAARQKMRLHTFTALTLMCLTTWKENEYILEERKAMPANERRYIPMQISRCFKAAETVVRMLNKADQWPSPSSTFFEDASERLQTLLLAIKNTLPRTSSATDMHSVLTYLVYAALYEWQALACDERQPVLKLISEMKALADHLIKNDSPLLEPMNKIFWATRDYLHSQAPLPIWDFKKHPSSAELYKREKEKKTAKAA